MNWQELILPGSVNLIIGRKGRGKSALGYYLAELIAPLHNLLPTVVNFPREKQFLLPDSYTIKELEEALAAEDAFVLVDEGTTQLPAGAKMEELVKASSSLSRQRNQIVIFIFHASRDVGSRILRGVDTVMIKEPSLRQIQQGSKDKWFKDLLEIAKREIAKQEGDKRSWGYVDAEDPEFRGLLSNPLPSFWSDDLSKVWKGVALSFEAKAFTSRKEPRTKPLEVFTCQSCNRFAYMVGGICEFCGNKLQV